MWEIRPVLQEVKYGADVRMYQCHAKNGINPLYPSRALCDAGVLCHSETIMQNETAPVAMTPVVIDGLYREAMGLAEEARTYFDSAGQWDRSKLTADQRVTFACESLKVTTRLMHIISWLLIRKAVDAGEMSRQDAMAPDRRLGKASATYAQDAPRIRALPRPSIRLILKSQDLYLRVRRLEDELIDSIDSASTGEHGPARTLLQKLEAAF